MSLPTWDQFMIPVLRQLSDKKIRSLRDIRRETAISEGLSEEQRTETLPSGQLKADNRIGWAVSYLTRVAALDRPTRGHYVITDLGLRLLDENPGGLNEDALRKLARPDDQWWKSKTSKSEPTVEHETSASLDPTEQIEQGVARIHEDVAAELLIRLQDQDPTFFEHAVVRLLVAMGYGGSEGKATVTKASGDEGIDGIIDQDALGVNRIYVQAKRYAPDRKVGRPDLQAFVGALSGKADSGLIITTGKFSKDAVEYERAVPTRIIMIDGKRFAELMIRYGVGTQTTATYSVVEVDEDFFE